MSFALVFFPHTRTSDVVPCSSFSHGCNVGETTRVRWEGRSYKGKILFVGAKELCEMKANSISADGELIEDIFDVSNAPQTSGSLGSDSSEGGPSAVEREQMMRQIRMEEDIKFIKDMLIQMNATLSSNSERIGRLEQVAMELLRRNPTKPGLNTIDYIYASANEVAELRETKGTNRNQFALALEKLVYKDDPRELELVVDERMRSKDRVRFIRQYYDVPEHLQDNVWKGIKEALNGRVRRLRKALRDGQSGPHRAVENEAGGDPFTFHD
ncbi:hypothetical protein GCK32_013061 [Trichostrongylus colubriformis]|uniref:Uncharacterized protein n=1 Tax=Trichostrongylus colubriformis TaxID=6319 RepID=A0AAN8FJG6_TRICO